MRRLRLSNLFRSNNDTGHHSVVELSYPFAQSVHIDNPRYYIIQFRVICIDLLFSSPISLTT
jgi:hypothetical protein